MIAIGNKTGNDCFIYSGANGALGNEKPLGIEDPVTAAIFRYTVAKYAYLL